ncbi:hypothetical protein [Croceicoccus hydrothermalis]|jgi:hypothetical protein|uniref:hypothetical protein n=1 Tax=Croceicoccus hydrothermalis TaxID=2867964 RepID=UPI001EFAFC47|nr:hypothetical protein [Croceicoccus hydrothermalis]
MKYLMTALALPLALAATPAAAQSCQGKECETHDAAPTQDEAVLKARQALARDIEAKKHAMAPAPHSGMAHQMRNYAAEHREPCDHGDDCLDAHGVCTQCPKVAQKAECVDCEERADGKTAA